MTLGEIIALVFIIIVFSAMIIVGIRLFKWNKRDMAEKKARHEAIRKEINN